MRAVKMMSAFVLTFSTSCKPHNNESLTTGNMDEDPRLPALFKEDPSSTILQTAARTSKAVCFNRMPELNTTQVQAVSSTNFDRNTNPLIDQREITQAHVDSGKCGFVTLYKSDATIFNFKILRNENVTGSKKFEK